MNETRARLALFSVIEGGHTFWSNEITTNGAMHVHKKLLASGYDSVKYGKIMQSLREVNCEEIAARIESVGAQFITPHSPDWPVSLNDLAAIPIGLVVKLLHTDTF